MKHTSQNIVPAELGLLSNALNRKNEMEFFEHIQ